MSNQLTNFFTWKGVKITMTALGILVLNMRQENEYFSTLGRKAASLQMEVYRFLPSAVDPQTETVKGERYCSNEQKWIQDTFPLPQYLYDRCFYTNQISYKKDYPTVSWLKSHRDITFIGYGLPNKWKVYNALKANARLLPFLPRTTEVKNSQIVLEELEKHKKLILKPASGSQGKGIIALFKSSDQITLQTQKNQTKLVKTFTNIAHFQKWIHKLTTTRHYLLQPFYSLQDRHGYPFDIRILLQKNELGNWIEQGRGVRQGKQKHIISNLHGGGSTIIYDDWIKQFSEEQRIYMETEINHIISILPNTLEQSFGRLFEIGIDISLDQQGKLWLLEANSKPGRQVILQSHKNRDQLYEAPLHYCKYLENTLRS